MQKELPYVLRESQFRRFERYIAEAVRRHPKALNCALINDMSIATFTARLRDAKASYEEHNWRSTMINREKFMECKDDLNVSQVGLEVWLGPKSAISDMKNADKSPEIPLVIDLDADKRTIKVADTPVKNFLILLSHKRLLIPRLRVEGLTEAELKAYQADFDISFDINPDGSTILI